MSAPDTSEDRINGAVGMCQAHGLHGSADLIKSLAAQLATARAEALEEAAVRVNGEYLVCAPDNAEDESYNRGITHAIEAIRALITPPKETE